MKANAAKIMREVKIEINIKTVYINVEVSNYSYYTILTLNYFIDIK